MAISAAGAIVVSWFIALVLLRNSRRRRRMAQETVAGLTARVEGETRRADVFALGEREAAWSTSVLARIAEDRRDELTRAASALAAAAGQAAALEGTIDAVRDDLRATHADLVATRRDLDQATTRLAQLEAELSRPATTPDPGLEGRVASLTAEIVETRRSVAAHAAEARELRHRLAVAQRVVSGPSAGAVDELVAEVEELRRQAADPALQDRVIELERALAEARARIDESTTAPPVADPTRIASLEAALADAAAAVGAAEGRRRDLEASTADLRTRVAAAEREAGELRDQLRVGRLETDHLRNAADEARQEADRRMAAAGVRIAEMERSARSGNRDSAALTAHGAVIADLEQRLAALGAARNAELRRLNEKIASMERLYVDVEVRDRRITSLEEELKDTAESRDAALTEVVRMEREAAGLRSAEAAARASLERFAGLERDLLSTRARVAELEELAAGDVRTVEVERLRGALQAERDRADRAVQRSALAAEAPATYAGWDLRLRARVDAAVADAVAPLQARIDHLHGVVVEKERRIAALVERPAAPEGPDDLTRIRGIGPKIAAILQELGITTFRDIATFTDDDVQRVGAHLPVYAGRIIDDDWIAQARAFAG